jgi:DNA replication protein DnaC
MVAGCPDGSCDGTGFLYDEEKRVAYPCTCRPGRIARRRTAAVAGRIPKAFRGVSFDREPLPSIQRRHPHVVREVRSYVDSLADRLAAGRGLWFTGDFGTGKTTLAMLISRTAIEANHTVAIYSLPRLLGMLRDTFRDNAPYSLEQLIDRLCSVELLHIDDVGAEQTSAWVLEQLYAVINTRYEDRGAMVLTTNLIEETRRRPPDVPEDQFDDRHDALLREQIGDRTVSRLYEMCGTPLPMFGEDQRQGADITMPRPSREERPPATPEEPAAPARWDPFDDATWEEEGPRYGSPRGPRAQRLD